MSDHPTALARSAQMGQDIQAGQRIEPGLPERLDQSEPWNRWADARQRVDLPHRGGDGTRDLTPWAGRTGEQQRSSRRSGVPA